MPLPYPDLEFVPFDPLPAAELNKMVANEEALADGSALDGLDPGTVSSRALTNPYKFLATQTGGITINTSLTKVTFDSETYDTGSNFATSTFTAPVVGFYLFYTYVRISAAVGMTTGSLVLYKNGAAYRNLDIAQVSNEIVGLNGILAIPLAASDTIELYAQTSGASSSTFASGTDIPYFGGFLMSAT